MRNNWIYAYAGYMKICVKHTSPERFINECASRGIVIWNVSYEEPEHFTACVLLADLSKLKKMVRHLSCKVFFLEKKGLPFFFRKVFNRKGMIAGAGVFIAGLVLLSNMVWQLEIDGTTPALEHELRIVLTEMGIERGKLQPLLPPPEKIQENIMNEMDGITWAGVTKKGAGYHFQIVEKKVVEEKEAEVSGHLAASRKAVVQRMFIEKGDVLVKPNQFVEKGDILVSGYIGREDNATLIAAAGDVIGEFWYRTEVEVPLSLTAQVLTGEEYRKHSIMLAGFNLPVWGFGRLEGEGIYTETETKKWEPFGLETPFAYRLKTQYEVLKTDEQRLEDEAVSIALEEAKKDLVQKFSPQAEIADEKVLHEVVDGGKVKVALHFRIHDNIAVKQPIIQGD